MKRFSTWFVTWVAVGLGSACDDTGSGDGNGNGNGNVGGGSSTIPGAPGTSTGNSASATTGSTGSSTGSTGTGTAGAPTTASEINEAPVFTEVPSGPDGGVDLSMCAALSVGAEQIRSPVDIIFVIDNSSSMDGEIMQVQERINADFAQIIEDSGVDFRVVMISRYGMVGVDIGDSDNPICIRAPLGAGDCSDPETQALQNNPPRFFHYSADIRSRQPFCDVLDGWDTPDELRPDDDNRPWESIAPLGWRMFVRENSFKNFVVITDDDVDCDRRGWSFHDGSNNDRAASGTVEDGMAAAQAFDQALRALSPRQFGTATNRKYKWHSIVAMEPYGNNEPWPSTEPVQTGICEPGSDGPGTGFQALSTLTGGLRWPTCDNESFDAIFRALAEGVILGSLSCEWEIPELGPNETFNPNEVNVQFNAGDGTMTTFPNVPTADDCGSDRAWYYNDPDDPTAVVACPATCDFIRTDPAATINVVFGCETEVLIR